MNLDEVNMKKFPGGEVHVELGNFDGQRHIFASITNTEDIIKIDVSRRICGSIIRMGKWRIRLSKKN